jgi:hypothetical protein
MLELADCPAPVTLAGLASQGMRSPTRKSKLQPFLDSGAMVEDDSGDGIAFVPLEPKR